jgi:iron(III) transport system ATP-binding protein
VFTKLADEDRSVRIIKTDKAKRGSDAAMQQPIPGRISIEHLTVEYAAGVPAVRDLTLEIASGEMFVLLGPSGCGKTTTMRCVAGLEAPTTGRITVGDETVVDADRHLSVAPHKRGVGMMFQSYAIWPHMSVGQNVGYSMAIKRVPKAEVRARVAELLKLVGLSGFEDRSASLLSGGQMQRVALARSLAIRPRALLLDEPLSNLDAKLRERLRFELRELQQRFALTSIYVTHDREEALALADRIGIMNAGELVQIASPVELYRNPATTFAASFMGMDTVCAGVVETTEGETAAVRLKDGSLVRLARGTLSRGDRAFVCGRSEDLRIVEGRGSTYENLVQAAVISHNFRGDRVRYHLRLASGDEIYAVAAPTESPRERGTSVSVSFAAAAVVLLGE